MHKSKPAEHFLVPASVIDSIPLPVLALFRGIGQVFFQDNALTGLLFVLGIAAGSPLMALGALVGAAIGTAVAWIFKFNEAETHDGIYGFNSTLVGIATFFFFKPDLISIALLLAGCIVVAFLTQLVRKAVPFPTYTAPFIVVTWVIFFLGQSLGAVRSSGGADLIPTLDASFGVESTAHGIGQVMFQGNFWTGLLFLIGIAINSQVHATWVLVGSLIGMLVASYHVNTGLKSLNPETLVEGNFFDNIKLGLYGYNATLAAVALYLWRKSLIAPILGILLSVPLTELVPLLGIPALTAPFVLATWIVLFLGWLDWKFLGSSSKSAS